jgi:hypothetical protein
MTEFPEERTGFTDMTFCLLRFEIANIFRRILYIPPGPNRCTEFFAGLTIEQKEKWITDCYQAMEAKYLKNIDMSIPLCWVTATVARLIMSKMWLVVYHPSQRKDGGTFDPIYNYSQILILRQVRRCLKRPKTSYSSLPSKTLNIVCCSRPKRIL